MGKCSLCPRRCGADRTKNVGYCGADGSIRVARAALHFYEEPCISGTNGSGTIFFSGCTLKCCFCQNYKISSGNFGKSISEKELAGIILRLQNEGAHNINLVNPTHYVSWIIRSLDMVKHKLNIPIVYNSGGYESLETLEMLDGYIDIYLPDLKYFDNEPAKRYSHAENYFSAASAAVKAMTEQTGKLIWNGNLLARGTVIRHLVMPKGRNDSIKILDWISKNIDREKYLLSLMSQFTPTEGCAEYPEINRRVSTLEYNAVLDKAISLDMKGYMQSRTSAEASYTPDFDLSGI